jgi:hypothetical protein
MDQNLVPRILVDVAGGCGILRFRVADYNLDLALWINLEASHLQTGSGRSP